MNTILAMAAKDIRLLVRDRMGFFFSFVFPLLYATFFGMVFAGDDGASPGLPVALVDEDSTASSRAFVDTLRAGGELQISETSREAAVEAVRRGRRIAWIALPPGFGAAREAMFSGSPPEIEIGLDPARAAEGGMLEGILMKYMSENMQKNFSNPALMQGQIAAGLSAIDSAALSVGDAGVLKSFLGQLDTLVASGLTTGDSAGEGGFAGLTPVVITKSEVVRQRSGPRSAYEFSFPQGILWGILSTAFGFALSLVIERRRGTLVRLRSAPVSRAGILAGKAVACFATIVTVTVVLLLVAIVVFGVRPDSIPLLVLAVLSSAIGFVGLMMVISVLGRTEASVSGLGWALMMVMAMTGGAMIPLFILPAWVQSIGNLSPVKWGILALEGAIWRGFTPVEMLLPCGILAGVGVVGFLVGARAFRWTEA